MQPEQWLLDILCCPRCRVKVQITEDRSGLLCPVCGLLFPIRDGVPVMLVSEAKETGASKA